jgi:hypothetical protein
MGLFQSYTAQGKTEEAKAIKEEFHNAWQYSDIEIITSVL